MRRFALAFVVASMVVATLGGQHAVEPAAETPTLRASVEQVVVDVVVTDASGAVVPGLTAADFQIREDGAPQPIVTFSEVVLPFDRREPGAAPLPPAEVRSNRAIAEGRVYLLLLDDLFVMAPRTPVVQQVARDFIGRYVQPGDLVAVTTTGGMAGTSQAFTEDMSLVGRAVDRFVGKKVRSAAVEKLEQAYRAREMDPMRTRRTGNANTPLNRDGAVLGVNAIDDEVLDRGRLALRTVKNAVQSMAGVAGRRKTVVYVSEGVDIPLGPGDSTEIAREVHGDHRPGGARQRRRLRAEPARPARHGRRDERAAGAADGADRPDRPQLHAHRHPEGAAHRRRHAAHASPTARAGSRWSMPTS